MSAWRSRASARLPEQALDWLATATIQRRDHDDGWLAVFFEFWAHVLRHPELRERFAAIHARILETVVRHAAAHSPFYRAGGSPRPAPSATARSSFSASLCWTSPCSWNTSTSWSATLACAVTSCSTGSES